MDLEHPDITRTLRTGYPHKKRPAPTGLNKKYTKNKIDAFIIAEIDSEGKGGIGVSKVKDLTINDLIEKGASLDVTFFGCQDLQTAYDKLKPYTSLGSISKHEREGTVWLNIRHKINNEDRISITAFL